MADADDKLDFCKQALGELGTRSTITSLAPADGSPEAYYCNLFFDGTRDQVLRAAHWNFAGRSAAVQLWKATPGTPENPAVPSNYQWNLRYPALPWLYSYLLPGLGPYPLASGVADPFVCVQVRRVRGQPNAAGGSVPQLYGGGVVLPDNFSRDGHVKFEVASDRFDRAGNHLTACQSIATIAISSPGSGYQPADYITLTGGGSIYGSPATVQVTEVSASGAVLACGVWTGGTFTTPATSAMTQLSTSGGGTGFQGAATFGASYGTAKVILTNAQNILVDYTTNDIGINEYDALFGDAFMLALEGKLALALLGDRALYTAKLQEANNSIINARVRDGNEGLTTYDHVPDWLQVRGVASMSSAGEWFNPPYGPLFAV